MTYQDRVFEGEWKNDKTNGFGQRQDEESNDFLTVNYGHWSEFVLSEDDGTWIPATATEA